MISFFKRLILFMAVVYVILCALVFVNPELFFYNPISEPSDLATAHEYGYPAERVDYKSADGTGLFAWYTKPEAKKHRVVVFMHGNSYRVQEFFYKLIPFMKKGYATFMPEYRGFGGIKGKISQKNLEADALAAVKQLHKLGYKNEDIIIYGMSLGSHMAVNTAYQLGQKDPFRGLVLEVPFDSLLNTAQTVMPIWMPFKWIMKDHYDNLSMIDKVNTPVLIMGGTLDTTVPVQLAQNLYEKAVIPKKMIIYKGGKHSSLYNFRNDRDILTWLEGNEKSLK